MPAWTPIQDLPDDWRDVASQELLNLADVWREQHERLRDTTAYEQFRERLRRRWSIETGIIENLYSIDRGTMDLLITHGVAEALIQHGTSDRPAGNIVAIVSDQREALEVLFDFVAQRRALSTSYVKKLHQVLTRNQPAVSKVDATGREVHPDLIRGDYKHSPNNPSRSNGSVHEHCPPERVAAEMDRLIETHLQYVETGVPAEVDGAWLHHRFTQIHPFKDGNGRVARPLASLLFMRAGWFPLVIDRDTRVAYIDALEVADDADLRRLVALFEAAQQREFRRVLSTATAADTTSVSEVIQAISRRLRDLNR